MPENMFSLSGGAVNPPPNLPNVGSLARDVQIPGPTNLDASPMMERFANIQNLRNQNALFQQTYAARLRSGEILANAPDTETGIEQLMKDPITAPFAGEIIKTMREANLSLIQAQGAVAEQSKSGLEGFYKMLPAVIADPSQFDTIAKNAMASMSPLARQNVGPAIQSLKTSLLDGLPKDPQQARAVLTQRVVGYSLAAGFPPDSVKGIIGSPTTVDQGGMKRFGVQLPPQFGGGFEGANVLPTYPAPTYDTRPLGPKGVPTTVLEHGSQATPLTLDDSGGASPDGANPMAPPSNAAPDNSADIPAILRGIAGKSMTGPSQSDEEANKASGKVVGEITSDMSDDAKLIPTALKRFDVMSGTLGKFQAGGLANVRGSLAQFMQGLRDAGFSGITQKDIDKVGNSSLQDLQVFNANVKPLVISELKAAAQGTGRVMRSEVDAFLQMMSSETDPKALMRLINQAKYALQIGYARSKMWPQFRDGVQNGQIKGAEQQDYYQYFNEHQNMLHLPTRTGGGLNLGPSPMPKDQGGEGDGAVKIKSAAEYNKLPKGTPFIDPKGVRRIKQ